MKFRDFKIFSRQKRVRRDNRGFCTVPGYSVKPLLLLTGRHFWNRKCRKKTWWQQEFAVFKCEATANSVTGHVCVNSNKPFILREKFAFYTLTVQLKLAIINKYKF